MNHFYKTALNFKNLKKKVVPNMTQLSQSLKKETRTHHSFTEQQMNAKAIFSEEYSADAYKNHLEQLLNAHTIIDHVAQQHLAAIESFNLQYISRVNDLKYDLKSLNHPINFDKEHISVSLKITGLAQLIGMLYVVKGSQLGGHFIGKKIDQHLKRWSIEKPQKFYKLSDAETLNAHWQAWCKHINKLSTGPSFNKEAIDSAKITFDVFCHPEDYATFKTESTLGNH